MSSEFTSTSNSIEYHYDTTKWIDMCIHLGLLSKQIRNKDIQNKLHMMKILDFLFDIVSTFDIDFENAWTQWNRKASAKVYISHM